MEEQKLIHTEVVDIDDLIQDDHNFNKGTEEGARLIERSFKDYGAGRSVLIDKHGKIIAGNKSQKAAIAAGIKRVRVIETTGDELIAVKRTDVELESEQGRKMALLDNQAATTATANLKSKTASELREIGDKSLILSPILVFEHEFHEFDELWMKRENKR